ncbi:MAG: phage holin family protein [Planctomycetaceae bacterium]
MNFLVHLIVTSALLLLVANIVRGVRIENWGNAFLAALVLGIVNAVIRPVMVILTLPLTVLTLGLFLFVVNALMLQLTSAFVPGMKIEGCGAALWGSLLLSVLNVLVDVLAGIS